MTWTYCRLKHECRNECVKVNCSAAFAFSLLPFLCRAAVPFLHLLLFHSPFSPLPLLYTFYPSVCLSASMLPLSSNWPQGPRSPSESHRPSIVLGVRFRRLPLTSSSSAASFSCLAGEVGLGGAGLLGVEGHWVYRQEHDSP